MSNATTKFNYRKALNNNKKMTSIICRNELQVLLDVMDATDSDVIFVDAQIINGQVSICSSPSAVANKNHLESKEVKWSK